MLYPHNLVLTSLNFEINFTLSPVFPGGSSDKEPACQYRRHKRRGFDPWVGKIFWSRKWQSTPVFLPGEPHGWRSFAGLHGVAKSQTQLKEPSTGTLSPDPDSTTCFKPCTSILAFHCVRS